jgi:hypothetical protein
LHAFIACFRHHLGVSDPAAGALARRCLGSRQGSSRNVLAAWIRAGALPHVVQFLVDRHGEIQQGTPERLKL